MVALGRIPTPVAAPFFRVSPPVPGAFPLVRHDDADLTPANKLPFATKYSVTVAASAAAVSGHRLKGDHTFSFTTPTVRLRQTRWWRRSRKGRFADPRRAPLQSARRAGEDPRIDLAEVLAARVAAPVGPERGGLGVPAKLEPRAESVRLSERFRTRSSRSRNPKLIKPANDLVVLETRDSPPPIPGSPSTSTKRSPPFRPRGARNAPAVAR